VYATDYLHGVVVYKLANDIFVAKSIIDTDIDSETDTFADTP